MILNEKNCGENDFKKLEFNNFNETQKVILLKNISNKNNFKMEPENKQINNFKIENFEEKNSLQKKWLKDLTHSAELETM